MKKIFYILLITQLTIGLVYSQSGWIRQNFNQNLELDGVFFTNENTGYIGSIWWDTTIIFKTINAGLNWFSIYDSWIGGYASLYFLNDNTGFATCYGIIKTTNAGLNWDLKFQSPALLFSLVFPSTDTGYACGKYNAMIKTTNCGENWFTQVNNGGMHQNLNFVDNNTGFTVSEDDFIMKTTNGGANWVQKNVGYYARLYAVNYINFNTGYCGGWDGQNMCAFKTTNGGENWTVIVNGPQGRINRITFVNNQTGYAVGTAFLKTTNSGNSWQIQQNLGYNELYSVYFVNELTGYACGYDYANQIGVLYKTTTGGEPIGIKPISTEIPKQFILHQNYPNPFNPNTKIKFSIPPVGQRHAFDVRLIIYDILGREVVVLVNEQLSPGVYEIEWSATGGGTNISSGIYFYQLKTDGFSETKKMVLLK